MSLSFHLADPKLTELPREVPQLQKKEKEIYQAEQRIKTL